MQVPPGDTRVWRLVQRCTGKVWRKREPLRLHGHRRAHAMAWDCATASAPKQGLFRRPLVSVFSLFPSLPLYGQFWDGAASSWKVMASSCFAFEATGCRANALYHPRASSTQYHSSRRLMKGCQSQYDGCACSSKTDQLFV